MAWCELHPWGGLLGRDLDATQTVLVILKTVLGKSLTEIEKNPFVVTGTIPGFSGIDISRTHLEVSAGSSPRGSNKILTPHLEKGGGAYNPPPPQIEGAFWIFG